MCGQIHFHTIMTVFGKYFINWTARHVHVRAEVYIT